MINKLLKKIAKVFETHRIPYMIIGGQAVLLHGLVRLTEDIDITLGLDITALSQIKKLVKQMGLVIPKNIDDNFVRKKNVLIGIDIEKQE